MSPWLFNVYIDAEMKEVKMEMGEDENEVYGGGKERRLPGLFYADNLVLCGDSEKVLRAIVERLSMQ